MSRAARIGIFIALALPVSAFCVAVNIRDGDFFRAALDVVALLFIAPWAFGSDEA